MTCELKHQILLPAHSFWINCPQIDLEITASDISSESIQRKISPLLPQAQQIISKLLYKNKLSYKEAALLKSNLSDPTFFYNFIRSKIDQLIDCSSCDQELKNKIESLIALSEQQPQDFLNYTQSLVVICKLIYASTFNSEVNITNFSADELEEYLKRQETSSAKYFLKLELHKTLGIKNIDLMSYINELIDRNNNKELKKVILNLLRSSMEEENVSLSRFKIEDYHHSFSNICEDDFISSLYFQITAEKLVQTFVTNVIDLTTVISAIPLDSLDQGEQSTYLHSCQKAALASRIIFDSFKDLPLPSATTYCSLYGRMQNAWKKNSPLFSKAHHSFCDCHISENIHNLWPLEQTPFHQSKSNALDLTPTRTAAILSCNYGSGHKQATATAFDVMKKLGYHAYSVDIPDEVLKEEANLFSSYEDFLGPYCPKLTSADIFNTLMQKKAFSLINFLSGNDPHAGRMRTLAPINTLHVKKIVHRLLIHGPEIVVVNYLPDIRNIIEAAKILDLPVMHTHTDVSPYELTWRIPPHPYEKFYELLPYDGYQDILTPSYLKPNQVRITGPVCNSIFDSPCPISEIEQKRKDLQIDPGKKVILISNGVNGVAKTPPFLNFLKTRYRSKSKAEIPFHVVLLCGKNNFTVAEDIQNKFSEFFPITALSSVPTEEMKILMSMASQGGMMVGKPGGLSVVESQKMHLPIVFDCIQPTIFSWSIFDTTLGMLNRLVNYMGYSDLLPWEQDNRDFVIDHEMGEVCDSEAKFNSILDAFEKNSFHYKPYSPNIKFSEEFSKIIEEVGA